MRIEVGYGLEGELTDAQSRTIIETRILPHFRQGDFAAGIKAGVAAMIETLGGSYDPALPPVQVRESDRAPSPFPLAVALPIFLIIVLNRLFGRRRRGRYSRSWGAGHRARRLGRPAWRLRRWRAGRRVQRWRRQLRRRWRFGALVTMAFLTEQDRQKIASAIIATERTTSGELVAVVAQAADDYRYIPLLWPALAALLLPAILLTIEPGMSAWTLYLAQAATFIVLALLAHLPAVRMALVPDSMKRRRASRLAREQFFEQRLHLTRARTGVLIFVSVAEHYVEIIADEGINALVPPGTWDKAVADFVERVRAGRIAEGFLAVVEVVGTRLAEHFPRPANDRDELPNRLIEI